MQIEVKFDATPVRRALSDLERKQVPYAMAVALTRTAKQVEAGLVDEMTRVFDRPTRWTLRSAFTKPATKRTLTATVGMKDQAYGGNRLSSAQILAHHFTGGDRHHKALEMWLRRGGYLGNDEFVVPGAGARLNRYGNMSRALVQQIMSQLHVGLDPSSYSSKSTRSQRNVRRAGVIFWSRGSGRTAHLPRGAWQRSGVHLVRPLLLAVDSPTYRQIIDFPRLAQPIVREHIHTQFERSLADALRTMRR